MKKSFFSILLISLGLFANAQNAKITWPLSDVDNLSAYTDSGNVSCITEISYLQGSNISKFETVKSAGAATGYTSVSFNPYFTTFYVTTRQTSRTAGYCISFSVTPQTGHTFKPTEISFDAAKCGTDGGNIDVAMKFGNGSEISIANSISPLRNKIDDGNPNGYSHHDYKYSGTKSVNGEALTVCLYIYNINGVDNENPKSIAFRNVEIKGIFDDISSQSGKPAATPLKRGLMSISLSGAGMGTGNLISWRFRNTDDRNVRFKLYRGTAESQTVALNGNRYIGGKTNFHDNKGTAESYYKLETYDKDFNLISTEVSGQTWDNQTKYISLEGGSPTDPTSAKATYTPNDASYCDMDGDGEYEIILKWAPSNEKDAASSGTTSPAFYGCYKLSGKRLWILHTGPNMFNSAHTTPFIAWDLDGDGYGEFMVKTAPGAIDGQGNYISINGDDPTASWKNSRGKQVSGPEYISVFDGQTGVELKTIPYHTDYSTGASYWGDSNQNRSERYLAGLAYLDGEDNNPSPIFARGYYSGAFVGAYDWDGENLTLRWVHRAYSSSNGKVEYADGSSKTLSKTVYGEGAHWIGIADCDGDGKQEIIYGSACINDDGTTLYRTGLGHGDALHVGDFDTEHDGLEVFMVHEHSPYGMDMRDAKTGSLLLHKTASADTGRGIIGHFDPTAVSSYWQFSATSSLYGVKQGTDLTDPVKIVETISHGGGASLNNRIYWNGDLYDDFFDKSVLEFYNPDANGFWRLQVNNGNYVYGRDNNSTKHNPCVLGDILGDWREEIVNWATDTINNTANFYLVINATSFETDYRIPHLMDDAQYRAQVVNQNCCYNQPPHLSYDPAVKYSSNPLAADTIEGEQIIEDGDYYVQNVGSGLFLQGGSYWGTHAICDEAGINFTFTQIADGTYSMNSHINNGGSNNYLSDAEDSYVDATEAELTLAKLANGNITISNGSKYLAVTNGVRNVSYSSTDASSTYSQWKLLTKDDILTQLHTAFPAKKQIATTLIQDPNFGRNDQRYSSWTWSSECNNKNNNGAVENYCVESWHSTFTFSQKLTNIPNGTYLLYAQGFYRQDGTDDTNLPILFANDESSVFPKLTGSESSMSAASSTFTAGNYEIDPIAVIVSDGNLTIGVKNTNNANLWVIWDNFRLYYLGEVKEGDINGDGDISISDLTWLIDILNNKRQSPVPVIKVSDVNKNGKVNKDDVDELENKIFKSIN